MSRKVFKEVCDLMRQQLAIAGYRKRSGGIYTREIKEESLGFLGLNRSDELGKHSLTRINPVIGVRNHAIEQMEHEIIGKLASISDTDRGRT